MVKKGRQKYTGKCRCCGMACVKTRCARCFEASRYMPTPEQIAEAAAKIRAGWSWTQLLDRIQRSDEDSENIPPME